MSVTTGFCWKNSLYNSEEILASTAEAQPHKKHKDLRGNPFSLKGKTTGQTPNNFTI